MLPFLKAPADAPLMTDKHEIDARYRYWRRHILLTIWLGYALFYFTRKSFNAAVPEILANGVLSRSDIGLLATLFYITYGVSKFVSGIVSDRSNARYFMGIGLIATGIINILFGFSTSLWAFAVLWVLNAFFQGWGSPVCARLLTAWYSRTERGGWWALWNTAHNVGGALIPIVMAAAALHYGWRAGMMIAGCMAIVVGIFLCWRLRDRPQAVGLPAVGDWRHDALEIAQQCEGAVEISSVVVASGSAGTHAGLAVGLEQLMPQAELIGVTVSRSVADQLPKVVALQQAVANSLELQAKADITLWDDYFAPGYGTPNEEGMAAVKLLAQLEGILLDPVYTGKAMAGLIDGITQKRFKDEGPILFVHTGGAPALFAYHPHL